MSCTSSVDGAWIFVDDGMSYLVSGTISGVFSGGIISSVCEALGNFCAGQTFCSTSNSKEKEIVNLGREV